MIYPNCRDRFTQEDFDFIVHTLARSERESVSLADLLTDAEIRDTILDQERLVQALLSNPSQLRVSPQFFFYLLVRYVLKGNFDRKICDYVAAMLEAFSRPARLRSPANGGEGPIQYLSDMLVALQRATPREGFLIRVHVGNYALFVTGIFRETLERRRRRGAPNCAFYEDVGSASYGAAALDHAARRCELDGIYRRLSEEFREVRRALNRLSEELLSLHP